MEKSLKVALDAGDASIIHEFFLIFTRYFVTGGICLVENVNR